jgi:hypothetical protein
VLAAVDMGAVLSRPVADDGEALAKRGVCLLPPSIMFVGGAGAAAATVAPPRRLLPPTSSGGWVQAIATSPAPRSWPSRRPFGWRSGFLETQCIRLCC